MRHLFRHAASPEAAEPITGPETASGPITYTMDPGHTEVIATWNHFGFSTPSAMFCRIAGTLVHDANRPEESAVEVTIPVEGLHTTVPLQDEHLKGAEFFDAATFPDIRFKSTQVKRGAAPDKLEVTGDLTVHGVTKSITLAVTVNKLGFHEMYKAQAAGFDATAKLNRSDFGVGAHVPMVGDRIDLKITAEAVESKAWEVIRKNHSE
ncbi:MAG: YceI family protein [Gammaproteobacteria bacterium]